MHFNCQKNLTELNVIETTKLIVSFERKWATNNLVHYEKPRGDFKHKQPNKERKKFWLRTAKVLQTGIVQGNLC